MTLADLVYGPVCTDLAAEDRKILLERELLGDLTELSHQITARDEAERRAADFEDRVTALAEALERMIAASEAVTELPRIGQLCVADSAFEKSIMELRRARKDARDVLDAD